MGLVRLSNQVAHYTGSPVIAIPLVGISGRELGVDVSLSYNSFGHRVQDVAGSVGLGWNLVAGGVITRVVKGEPDNLTGGFCNVPGNEDEPDMYTFSIMGMTGKFVLAKNGTPLIMPFQDLIIKAGICGGGSNGTWEIIDGDGTRYIFGSSTESREITAFRPIFDIRSKNYVSSWLLDRIVSANGTDEITFQYESASFSYESYSYFQDFNTSNNSVVNSSFVLTQNVRLPKTIVSSGGRIEMEYEAFREDVAGAKSLKNIKVFNINNLKIEHLDFRYSYFGPQGSTGICRRLRLDQINDRSTTALYSFSYNLTENLPCRNSKHFDYLGLYNNNPNGGNPNISSWIADDAPLGGTSRAPHAARMRANLLTGIAFRGGASIQYNYEPHSGVLNGVAQSVVSGNRVWSIVERNGQGVEKTTSYNYTLSNGTTSGIVANNPIFRFQAPNTPPGVTAPVRRFSHSLGDQFDMNGTFVGYSRVVEFESGKGSTEYEFTNYNTNQDLGASHLFTKSTRFWERGQPTSIRIFNQANNLLYTESYVYNLNLPNQRSYTAEEKYDFSPVGNYSATYTLISRPFNLDTKTTVVHDQIDPNRTITSVEKYEYQAPLFQNIRVLKWNSTNPNESMVTEMKYVTHTDYNFQSADCTNSLATCLNNCTSGNNTCENNCYLVFNNCVTQAFNSLDPDGKAIYKMRERHVHNVVIESMTFLRRGTTNHLLGSTINRFNTIGTDLKVVPASTWARQLIPTTSYVSSSINSSSATFTMPANFFQIESGIYDSTTGMLTSTSSRDGTTTQYAYSNQNTTLAQVTTNPGPNSFQKSFIHRPLVGTTRETDTNGFSVHTEYDILNRPRLVSDNDNNIIKRYRYHYQNETPNFKIISNPGQILVGQSATFSLDDIVVTTGGPVTRTWTTGTGITYSDNRTTMTHTYTSPGIYNVTATINTNEYSPVTRTYQLLVSSPLQITTCVNGPQQKDFCNPSNNVYGSCTQNQSDPGFSTIVANFASPISTGCAGAHTYLWQYRLGSGSWVTFGSPFSNTADFFHNPNQLGNYEIRCTITDSCNSTATSTVFINVYKSNPNCTPIQH
jgi:hypothetical protein